MRPLVLLLLASTAYADSSTDARKILDELVAIDTSNPPGNEALAAQAVARRLQAAGIKPTVVEFAPGRANVIARLKGDGSKKPLLLLAHLDVVGAAHQPWTLPPFTVTEKDGWLYGRGVIDDKGWAAVALTVFLEAAQKKTPLHRDLILAFTGDEESGGEGIRFLLANHKELIGDAELALNEGGSLKLFHDKVATVSFQAAEKIYQDYVLTAHGAGGHSSIPNDENAIYRLSRALDALAKLKFPVRLSLTVRESLRLTAGTQPPERAAAMRQIAASSGEPPAQALAVLDAYAPTRAATRTTCVATLLSGGTRENALPVEARATVNCRVMPSDKLADVEHTLAGLAPDVSVQALKDNGSGPEIPVDGVVPRAIGRVAHAQFGAGVIVTPAVGLGASDSRFLRKAGVLSYGVGVFPKPEEMIRGPHGPDEGVPAASVAAGVRWLGALVAELQ